MLLSLATKNILEKEVKKWTILSKIVQMLARILLCNICANLIDFIKNIIFSEKFLSFSRNSHKDFVRNRILPFHYIIFFLMNLIKGSYQDELDYFFKALDHAETFVRKVTKSAFCKARKKLKAEAFSFLNSEAVNYFYKHFNPKKWCGFTLLAVDGSTVKVPRTPEVQQHFGVVGNNWKNPCALARISQMFDVLNKITVDAIIAPKSTGERECCATHFLNLMPNDLVLLDRGYPAYWLFKLILSLGGHFCARVSIKNWVPVRKFFRSGKMQKIIRLKAPATSFTKCNELGLDTDDLTLRLIRIELSNGETEILATSLTDMQTYPVDIFNDLYHCRWPVEEDYKFMKCRVEIENFTGKSVLSVYQDFHARVFSKNLTAMLAFPARLSVEQDNGKRYPYQINFTQVYSKMKDTIVLLFDRPFNTVKKIISSLHDLFIKTVEPIRPNRQSPRNHKISPGGFYPTLKPVR